MFDQNNTDPVADVTDLINNVIEQLVIRDLVILKKEEYNLDENQGLIFDARLYDIYSEDEFEVLLTSIFKILHIKVDIDDISEFTTFNDLAEMIEETLYNF